VFPFFRNHSALRTQHQEPWQRGQPYEALIRSAIELRYRLLPYIYTACAEAARTGAPITRPLVYAYPREATLATIEDEFLLGPDLLIAPILEEDQIRRSVQFPPGAWHDWLTGERHTGLTRVDVDAPLDVLPIYVREGAIVPLGPVMEWVGQLAEEPLTLKCYLGPNPLPTSPPTPPLKREGRTEGKGPRGESVDLWAEGTLYEDDGESPAYQRGAWRRTRYVAERSGPNPLPHLSPNPSPKAGGESGGKGLLGETITLRAETEGGYDPGAREHTVELHLPHPDPVHPPTLAVGSIRLNGGALAGTATVQRRRYDTLVRVPLGRVAGDFTVEVELRG